MWLRVLLDQELYDRYTKNIECTNKLLKNMFLLNVTTVDTSKNVRSCLENFGTQIDLIEVKNSQYNLLWPTQNVKNRIILQDVSIFSKDKIVRSYINWRKSCER